MNKQLCHLLILFLLLICSEVFATHIVGGEMYYKNLGNNDYEIRLTVYRDCYNGIPPFDNPASVGFFNASNQLVTFVNIPFVDLDTLPPAINAPCFIPPTDVCYEVTTYVDTVNLPPVQGGYQVVYQRCCRNQTIANLVNPNATGATFLAHIPGPEVVAVNSNPVFNALPPNFLCAGAPFSFDHSAFDYDGDSLVYELFTPLDGANQSNPMPQPPNPPPYNNVVWLNPFNVNDMLGGIPLSINSQTGLLTATPGFLGQYVIGVRVKEYRNGNFISQTQRDYQFNVVACQNLTIASIYSPIIECNSYTASYTNNSYGATSYYWDFGDTSTMGDTSHLSNPNYTYPDTGTYTVMLIAYSGIDSNCNDTTYGIVHINPPFTAHFYYDIDQCNYTITVFDSSYSVSGTPVSWLWDFGDNTTDTLQSVEHTYSDPGTYTITLIATNSDGCIDTVTLDIDIPPKTGTATTDLEICIGDSIQLNASGGFAYSWDQSPTLSEFDIPNPIAYPDQTTTYVVHISVIDQNGDTCIETHNSIVTVLTGADLLLTATADDYWIDKGANTVLHASPDNYSIYTWYPAETLSDASNPNPIASPMQTTTYVVTIVDSMGCITSDTVVININPLDCGGSDVFIPSAFTPNGDDQNDLLLVRSPDINDLYFALYDRWGQLVFETKDQNIGWDGTFKGEELDPGVFVYYLEVTCKNKDKLFYKGNVTLIR